MAQRLVYSPKCWAFVKNTREEIMDLTEYVIGGEINRLLNQVSTAKLTLRNPDRIFTRPGEVAFHPQDPITIFLERTPGHPVQVFTGFLDKTPYYQMRPGPITLEASCTLKKLLYTWYQLAQPYTLSLLEHFGWVPTRGAEGEVIGPAQGGIEGGQGTELADKWAAKAGQEGFQNSPNGVPFSLEKSGELATNDGSFANLLWAILFFIGDWQDEKIWIESVPPSVPKLINKLWNDFEQNDKTAQEEINQFWAAAIGIGSHGKGGGSAGGENSNRATPGQVSGTVVTASEFGGHNDPSAFSRSTASGAIANDTLWGFAELSNPPSSLNFSALGNLPMGTKIKVGFGGKTITVPKVDVGAGGEGLNGHIRAIDLTYAAARALGVNENWTGNVTWALDTGSEAGSSSKAASPEEIQRAGKAEKSNSTQRSRLDAMISRASEISNKNYHYSWGGGHTHAGTPSLGPESSSGGTQNIGFDCSGSVGAVLAAGGFISSGSSVGSSSSFINENGHIGEPGPGPKGKGITIYTNSVHEWMTINGRYFGTGWNKNPNGGAGWGSENESKWPSVGEFQAIHLNAKQLEEPFTGAPPPALAGTESETSGGESISSTSSILSQATAAAFASNISLPGSLERAEAQIFGGQKALMNSQKLMNFVQQVCQASLRSFQSLPNGDFYAFYPDYFGEFGHHDAYWLIYDIEILDGGIDLSDDNLVTHVFSLGNPIYPASPTNNPLVIEQKAGVMTIFEAMDSEGILYNLEQEEIDQKRPGVASMMNSKEAVEFLRRYGPRVLKEEYPLVTSTIYECLLAYQQFLLGWSRQFITPFTFTFMPELFPGGKVGFPEHGIQMFIESVTHTWDTTNGYQTVAQLTAPSVLQPNAQTPIVGGQNLPPNMVDALVEPLRDETKKKATAPKQRPALPSKTTHKQVN